jgi:methyl-accepting chemotaxis protein
LGDIILYDHFLPKTKKGDGMARKILSGTLIALSSILLILSMTGIGMVWIYKGPLTQEATTRLQAIDNELGQAQTAFKSARLELERTLRLVEAAEASMESLKKEFALVKTLFDNTNGVLDNQVLPGLIASREKIDQAKSTLQGLRDTLAQLNSLPLVNLPGDKLLGDLIASADSLDAQIVQLQDMVKNASTFISDASYLMGGDFTETKTNLQNFLAIVTEYDQKLTGWRTQIAGLLGSLPGWITGASIGLTVFLLWFGFSQTILILHGLTLWRGDDPLAVLRKPVVDDVQI